MAMSSSHDKCSSLSPSRGVQPCGFRVSLNDMLAAGMVVFAKCLSVDSTPEFYILPPSSTLSALIIHSCLAVGNSPTYLVMVSEMSPKFGSQSEPATNVIR